MNRSYHGTVSVINGMRQLICWCFKVLEYSRRKLHLVLSLFVALSHLMCLYDNTILMFSSEFQWICDPDFHLIIWNQMMIHIPASFLANSSPEVGELKNHSRKFRFPECYPFHWWLVLISISQKVFYGQSWESEKVRMINAFCSLTSFFICPGVII
jgi:hypothetical protein